MSKDSLAKNVGGEVHLVVQNGIINERDLELAACLLLVLRFLPDQVICGAYDQNLEDFSASAWV